LNDNPNAKPHDKHHYDMSRSNIIEILLLIIWIWV